MKKLFNEGSKGRCMFILYSYGNLPHPQRLILKSPCQANCLCELLTNTNPTRNINLTGADLKMQTANINVVQFVVWHFLNPAPKLLHQINPSTLDIRHNMLQFYSFNSNQEHASIRTSQFQPLLPINCQIQENNLPTASISFSNRRWTCSRHLIINVELAKD